MPPMFLGYKDALKMLRNAKKERKEEFDMVIFADRGSVIRFSHEVPEILQTWEISAAFVFEAITESE